MKGQIIAIALLLLSIISQGQDYSLPIDQSFQGTWKGDKECEFASGSLTITAKNPIAIEVNSNQIYILANVITAPNNKDILLVYFDKTDDLGAGGVRRAWKSYSKDKPIAELHKKSNGEIKLVWNGFYNVSTKKYEWTNEADWNTYEDFKGILYKCN